MIRCCFFKIPPVRKKTKCGAWKMQNRASDWRGICWEVNLIELTLVWTCLWLGLLACSKNVPLASELSARMRVIEKDWYPASPARSVGRQPTIKPAFSDEMFSVTRMIYTERFWWQFSLRELCMGTIESRWSRQEILIWEVGQMRKIPLVLTQSLFVSTWDVL